MIFAARSSSSGVLARRRRLPETPAGSSIDQLRQAFHASPDNYGVGYQLYREQMRQGKIDEALMTVRHFTELPGSPRYFHFLEAEAWAAKGKLGARLESVGEI